MTRNLVTAILTVSNESVNYYSWVTPSRNSGTYFGHLGPLFTELIKQTFR